MSVTRSCGIHTFSGSPFELCRVTAACIPWQGLANQNARIVEFGSVELMHSTLFPEARGEKADKLNFIDFMNISLDGELSYEDDN